MAQTPTILLASSGLVNGQGIAISPGMISTFNEYKATAIPAAISALLTTANATATTGVTTAIAQLPNYFQATSTITTIETQAAKILAVSADGYRKFGSYLGLSQGFASTAAEFKKSLSGFGSAGLTDLGVGIKKFSDIASNGLGSVFGNGDNLKLVAASLATFGIAYDVTQPAKLGDPETFFKNLTALGLNNVGSLEDKFDAAGVDIGDFSTSTLDEVMAVMATVQGSDLQKVLDQTEVKPYKRVTDLSQLLKAEYLLNPSVVAAIPGEKTLSDLGEALGNIGGKFKTWLAMSTFLAGVNVAANPALDAISSPVPASVASSVGSATGSGSGANGAPTVLDIIGCVSGHVYTAEFANIIISVNTINSTSSKSANLIAELGNTASVISSNELNDANVAPAVSTLTQSITDFMTELNQNVTLSKLSTKATTAMSNVTTQYNRELSNVTAAGIDFTSPAPKGNTPLLNMANNLHTYGVDKQNLGLRELWNNIADTSDVGEAIKAALAEGQNLAKQQAAGITPSVGA